LRDDLMEYYSENPFRVLGLPSTASVTEAARKAQRLLKWIELDEAPPIEDFLSFLGRLRLDRDTVKKAKQQIEDPRSRIYSELFWPSADFAYFEGCEKLLRQGQYKDFIAHCEYAISQELAGSLAGAAQGERLSATLARHLLAVYYHAAAVAITRRTANPIAGDNAFDANWELAFRFWLLVWKDDLFWEYLAQRVRNLKDARVKTEFLLDLRNDLPKTILSINVALGLESLERSDPTELVSQTKIINSSPFSQRLKTEACEALVGPFHRQFEKACKEIAPQLSDKTILGLASTLAKSPSKEGSVGTLDQEKLRPYLTEVERSINRRVLPVSNRVKEANLQGTEYGVQILDGTAYLLRALYLALNNHAGLPRHGWRIANIAHEYAASQECRERISDDQRTLNYMSLQQDASELAEARRFRESLTKLEQALHFASNIEERHTIEQWMEQAKKLLAYEDLKPIDRAPSLSTFNGIGTKLYGRRDYDATTNSYIATLFFTFLFIPIFPIAAYRVIEAGGGYFRFLGKARLSRAAFVPLAIWAFPWAFLLVLAMISGDTDYNPGTQTISPQSPTQHSESPDVIIPGTQIISPQSPTVSSSPPGVLNPSGDTGSERETLRRSIETERARLDAEKASLEEAEAQREIEGRSLREQRRDLERRQNEAATPGSEGPSDYEIDSFNEALRDFKSRGATLDARERRFQADIDRFNKAVGRYNSMR
jgi:hypothetical protein